MRALLPKLEVIGGDINGGVNNDNQGGMQMSVFGRLPKFSGLSALMKLLKQLLFRNKGYLQHQLVTVSDSGIHGKGLFAACDIAEDTVIGRCTIKRTISDGPHVLWLKPLMPVSVTCELRFINHHKQPNVAYYDDLTVVALRDIAQGEELFHHYGDDWDL